jgi:hypothetical protein
MRCQELALLISSILLVYNNDFFPAFRFASFRFFLFRYAKTLFGLDKARASLYEATESGK